MNGPTVIALIVLALVLRYVVSCIAWSFRDCRVCKGKGNHRPWWNRKLSRPCSWCGQTGKRQRYGRRIWNHFAKARKASR